MRTGVMQCKDVILNTIGPSAKPMEAQLVKRVVKENEKKKKTEKDLPLRKSKLSAREKNKRKTKEKVEDRILLGKLGPDVRFLKDLLGSDTEIVVPPSVSVEQVPVVGEKQNNKGIFSQRRVLEMATDALRYLENRKIFWQQTM